MKKLQLIILKSLFSLLFLSLLFQIQAQQSNIDSIILLLNNSKTEKGLDTLSYTSALNLIKNTKLSASQISQIEKTGDIFIKGNDEDLSFLIKFKILVSLTESDKSKAIDYGKIILGKLEKSKTPNTDILEGSFLTQLRLPYRNSDRLPEGFIYYAEKLNAYKLENNRQGMADCYYVLAGFYRTTGLLDQSLYNIKKSISYLDKSKTIERSFFDLIQREGRHSWINNIGVVSRYHLLKGEYKETIKYNTIALNEAVDFFQAGGKKLAGGSNLLFTARYLAQAKFLSNQFDSVDYFLNIAEEVVSNPPDYAALAAMLQIRSLYKIQIGELNEADSLLQECWEIINQKNIDVVLPWGVIAPDYYLALIRIKQNKYHEAIELLNKDIMRVKNVRSDVLRDYHLLAELCEKTGDIQKAMEAYKTFVNLHENIHADQEKYRTISFEMEQQMNEKEVSITRLEGENKRAAMTKYFSIGIATLLLIIVAGIYNRFRSKKKANRKLRIAFRNLKSTQSQLIQSEKMASLGELTAGIAHEIQNPLNFVNNFAEVSVDLVSEMSDEISNGNLDEVIEISGDLKQNLEKIGQHGKRASSIVKGMLEHSRGSDGHKEFTNINTLADEYLRLAYHGFRAKDKSFNADFKTDFDNEIPNINIVHQDIGRVLLNLINNAFHACNERSRTAVSEKAIQSDNDFKPMVSVLTSIEKDKLIIKVKDNGNGIPSDVLDKIFQPFFTTKPSGQGTGLGLSLSYDIIKAHGGELKAETKKGVGTVFIIQLPMI